MFLQVPKRCCLQLDKVTNTACLLTMPAAMPASTLATAGPKRACLSTAAAAASSSCSSVADAAPHKPSMGLPFMRLLCSLGALALM
jgi:hypothetical protein